MTDLTNLSNPGPIKTYSEEYWANQQNQGRCKAHRKNGHRCNKPALVVTLLRACAITALSVSFQIATSLSCETNAKPGPYGVDTACSSGTVLTTGEIHCGTNAPLRSANVCTVPA